MSCNYATLLVIVLSFTGFCCKAQTSDTLPEHETLTLLSEQSGENRIINVWLPPQYYASGADSFTVVYMPDGGLQEDFPHVAVTLSRLVKSGRIAPVILVGIENTQRRRDLTGPTEVDEDKKIAPIVGGSAAFRSFITNVLFPEIRRRYRIRDRKGIIGESLAGLFIVETFLQHPAIFDFYIAMDPSLWWNNHMLEKNAAGYLSDFPSGTKKTLWVACSADMLPYTQQFHEALKSVATPGLKWHFSPQPKETHATIYRAVEEQALLWSLQQKEGQ